MGVPVVTDVSGGTRYVWSASGLSLGPGQGYTFTINGTNGVVCSDTFVGNTARVIASSDTGVYAETTNQVSYTAFGLPFGVAVAVEQTPPTGSALVSGDAVAYRIVVANTGSATLSSLTLVDTVARMIVDQVYDQPAGFGTPAIFDVLATGTRYIWSATGLDFYPGTAYTFTVSGAVGLPCGAWSVGNTPWIMAGTACSSTSMLVVPVGFTVAPLTMNMNASVVQIPAGPFPAGSPVRYVITYRNAGSATTSSLVISDTVSPVITAVTTDQPSGFPSAVVVDAPGSGTLYAWNITGIPLSPWTRYTFTISGFVGPVCSAAFIGNTAYVSVRNECGGGNMMPATLSGWTAQPMMASMDVSRSPLRPARCWYRPTR
jgi:hypothetical protein